MNRAKLKSAVVAVAFLGFATVVLWQQLRVKRLLAEVGAFREQLALAETLREENEHLSQQLRTAAERSQADLSELVRLRGQAGRTRQIEQENAQLKIERERLAKQLAQSSASETNEPETPEQKLLAAKGRFGKNLGMALIMVADENEGRLPSDLRGALIDTVERLSSDGEHNIQAKQFELVYKGSLHEVKDGEETILAREKEPVQRSDGQWVRLYVMADGSSRYIAAGARDGFAELEKKFWPEQFRP